MCVFIIAIRKNNQVDDTPILTYEYSRDNAITVSSMA